ncbi:ABC transporter B family member 11-like [Zingiber officinale]|uniref:ABC transporter B family member 11-like n=1 Tax=Zingiber officinale TaxID=94328 RepID=UPI001C4CEF2D|nr:ABC transporter B family member 11-like [Zingiber officinale]
MEKEKEKMKSVPFHKLFSFADARDVALMTAGTVGAVGSGLAMPLMTIVFGELINAFGASDKDSIVLEVSKVVVKFIYLGAGAAAASFLQVACWMVSGERQAARIRCLYLKAILRQEIEFFDNESTTGEVISRMSGGTILIQDAIGEKVGKFIQLCATLFGSFIVALTKGWLLSLVLMSSIPLIAAAGAAMSLVIFKSSNRAQKAYAQAGTVVEHTVGSIRTVVSFNGENQAIDSYKNLINKSYKAAVGQGAAAGFGMGVVMFILFCSYGLAVWYGAKLIIEKGYDGGTVFNVMIAITTGGMSLGQASPSLSAFASGQAAAYKMFETINQIPSIDVHDTSGILLEDIKGEVELRDVHFSYPSRPEQLIFDGFSLRISSGTTMALVGESGSGKSTVISLVERFYDPQIGEVLIDGVNLKKLKLKWIRQQIGLVSQEPVLFTTTIKENITYGKESATAEEILRALELANAAKFIGQMPNGLDTMVGEHGTQLSGGQKQRIAIARVILKNPKILLLDEATSALDAESERVVQDALETIMTNRTTIVVAHRLSTIKNVDKISVVSRGKLVEQGAHDELIMDPQSFYSQLVQLQDGNKHAKEAPTTFVAHAQKLSRSGSSELSISRSSSKNSSLGRNSTSTRISTHFPVEPQDGSSTGYQIEEKNNHNSIHRQANIKRLAYLNKSEVPVLALGSVFAAIHGALFPVFGILISSVFNTFFEPPHELRKGSRFWALMYCLIGLIAFLVVPVQYYLFGVAGAKLIQRIRSLSFEKMVHQEIGWFDEPSNSSGQLGARLATDATTVRRLVGDTLAVMVQTIATIIVGIVIAMAANWKLALIILVLAPLLGLQEFFQQKFHRGFSGDAKAMYEEASQVASDAIASIRTVASFTAEEKCLAAYQAKCAIPVSRAQKHGMISGLGYGSSFLMMYCTYALCFYVGARFVHDGEANFSQVFKVFYALSLAALMVSISSTLLIDYSNAKDSAASIFAILDRESKIDSSSDEGAVIGSVRGDIKLGNVSFSYPSRPHVKIFTDFCLSIPPGKTIALVGQSGCGKSTVIALLERFYDPDAGFILLDGVDIKKLNIRWLRQQIGLVSQEPVLFNGTIRSNIAYGKQGPVAEDEIIAATEATGAHRFISGLPQGYDTNVGERGVQLSGGQKQRIAIARAILKDPKVLLLDEATSALDAESERVVQDALDRAMVGRTTVVIAHRLSAVRGADAIAVVQNGAVVERGRHEQLMGIEDGVYASLVALQTSPSSLTTA